jgi:hypothetical protein
MTGAVEKVMFGRNEGGGQNSHRWLDRVLNTPDDQLNSLFASATGPAKKGGA